MNVSIIIPIYKPDKDIMEKLEKAINEQEYNGKIEIIKSEGCGLAHNMNDGIKRAKYEAVVTLHQDSIPADKYWLKKLVEPLNNKNVVASVSRVHLPEELWNKFDIFAKALTIREKGVITPLMDEKGCAYRKNVLELVGFFDEKNFRTAGEDLDMYLKLKEHGKIAHPDCEIIHMHQTDFKNRLKKTYQNANGYGAIFRIHGRKLNQWYLGISKAIPIFGILSFMLSYPFRKSILLYLPYLVAVPALHITYSYGFWRGYISGRQD